MECFAEPIEEYDKTNGYKAKQSKRQSCGIDKYEQQRTTDQTKEIKLSKDENVSLLDTFVLIPSTSAVNTASLPKLCNAQSIEKEKEPLTKSRWSFGTFFGYSAGNQECEGAPLCTTQASVSGNLKRENSNAIYTSMEKGNEPDIKLVCGKSQFNFSESIANQLESMQYFESMQYLRVAKSNQMFSETTIDSGSDDHEMRESGEIKTLEDALRHFGLYFYLEKLDISLENVRRHEITENDHEENFKKIDKEIQKLSFKYHPDRVVNRGGTETEMATAQKLQTALNAVRTVLRYLNAAFLADVTTDHKFQFYSQLNIVSLCNEKEVKCRIYEMKFKLSMISRIKQQNIILEIRNFLIESKKCVSTYVQGNINEFKELSCSVLFHLNQCIEGFKKLCVELEQMEKRYKLKKDDRMLSFVQNMARDIKRDRSILDLLEKTAKSSMKGYYKFFDTEEFIDPYFVRPFVWYTNVILMCIVMARSVSVLDKFKFRKFHSPKFNEFLELKPLYHLAMYYSGNEYYKDKAMKILNEERSSQEFLKIEKCKSEIELKFREILNGINKNMEIKFNVDHYTEVMTDHILTLELEKCVSMMNEFEEKKQDLSESIKEVLLKTVKTDEKYDEIMQASKNLNSEIEEILESNKKLDKQISSILSSLI